MNYTEDLKKAHKERWTPRGDKNKREIDLIDRRGLERKYTFNCTKEKGGSKNVHSLI